MGAAGTAAAGPYATARWSLARPPSGDQRSTPGLAPSPIVVARTVSMNSSRDEAKTAVTSGAWSPPSSSCRARSTRWTCRSTSGLESTSPLRWNTAQPPAPPRSAKNACTCGCRSQRTGDLGPRVDRVRGAARPSLAGAERRRTAWPGIRLAAALVVGASGGTRVTSAFDVRRRVVAGVANEVTGSGVRPPITSWPEGRWPETIADPTHRRCHR
jgi:hypothetical protein